MCIRDKGRSPALSSALCVNPIISNQYLDLSTACCSFSLYDIKFNRIKVRNLIKEFENFGLDKKKFQLTIENLKKSDQSIKFYVEKNKRVNSTFNYKKNQLILKENFFDNSHEIILRSLSDLIHLVGKKPNFVRGKKIENILNKIKERNLRKETLGGCVIKMVNHTVILTKEV